jgi:GNAT superfamily N-acetyltransferase
MIGMQITLRRARPDEAPVLSDLALRSKGYDEAFLEACREDLTQTPAYIAANPVFVAVDGDRVLGFGSLVGKGDHAVLDALFVDPGAIGGGVGRRLFDRLVQTAREKGYGYLLIHSDPYAEPFYQRMGARRIGEVASSVFPGRLLPLLRFDL